MSGLVLIEARTEDLLGQPIRRPLPSARCRSIGPFVFFDHMLEHRYPAADGLDIAAHPHIGLATLTYLFSGELQHRDSLGSDQRVGAGDVSWMCAGAAVAHVERTPSQARAAGSLLHGLQVWLALPQAEEQGPASYSHHGATTLPESTSMGVHIRLIAGSGFCLQSPVPVRSPTLYAEIRMAAAAHLQVPTEHPERALYVISGEVEVDGQAIAPGQLAILPEAVDVVLQACSEAHLVIIGGASLGPRRMNWNFVASDPALIERARARWAAGDWPTVPGETRRIELPR